ncbi:MAG: glycoside hydrolase family 5 protein, partial [Lachnospiraceae bacterium]
MAPTKEKHGLHFKAGFFLGIFCLLFLALSPTVNAKEPLTGYSSKEIVEQMGIGWNLGNTLDATGGNAADVFSQEQSWGNPIVTGELIDAVGEAGFTTIRIPVTWYRHLSDDGTYTIDADFLERVKTVVDYAYENDMFIILNIHHEEWLNTSGLATDYEQMGEELSAIWTQLADYFADYDQHLIFEGMNEPRMAGTNVEWGGNDAGYAAVNYLNQVFVSTVRNSNKGYNQERCLMIPGYAASGSSNVLESIVIPTVNGEAVNNLIISVHCYSPYNFCLSDAMTGFDPTSSECVSEIDGLFDTLQKLFLDNGIPVVIGETSATNKNNTEAREKWAYYMANKSAAYGVPIVIWDNGANGSSGGECHAYINRATCEWNFPTVIKSLMDGLNSIEWGSGRIEREEATESENSSLLGGSVIWSDENGLTSTALWDYTYIAMGSKESYYLPGREIAVVYSGNGEPKVILDSSEMNVWWIPIDPDRIETLDDKKVAYFGYDT